MSEIVIKVNSHRAGDKLERALGHKPQYYYTWEHGGCFVLLSKDEADQVLPITGITRSRVKRDALGKCWSRL